MTNPPKAYVSEYIAAVFSSHNNHEKTKQTGNESYVSVVGTLYHSQFENYCGNAT